MDVIKICAEHDYTYIKGGNCPGCEYEALHKARSIFDPWQPSVEQELIQEPTTVNISKNMDDEIIVIRSQEELEKTFGLPQPSQSSIFNSVKFAISEFLKNDRTKY